MVQVSPLVAPSTSAEPSYETQPKDRKKARKLQLEELKAKAAKLKAGGQETITSFSLTPQQARLQQRPLDLPGQETQHVPHTIQTTTTVVKPTGQLPPEGDGTVKPKKKKKDQTKTTSPPKGRDKDEAQEAPLPMDDDVPMAAAASETHPVGRAEMARSLNLQPTSSGQVGAGARDPEAPPTLSLSKFPVLLGADVNRTMDPAFKERSSEEYRDFLVQETAAFDNAQTAYDKTSREADSRQDS